jgi:predicted glutamine amidotransferase
MCRFLCYSGPPVLLSELLYRPGHSLILQTYKAKERAEPLNGDGFGVGWYVPEIAATPCVFTSVSPAWSNQNLRRLAEHVRSPLFFAHVRAASAVMEVSEANCHPFQNGRYLWMHNGQVASFARIKRRLRQSLPDPLYESVRGSTDSEHAFAVFLDRLGDTDTLRTPQDLARALVETVARMEEWTAEAGVDAPSYYNFAVTDGSSIVAVRYVSDPSLEPISLYFRVVGEPPDRRSATAPPARAVMLASERLSENTGDWRRVAPNHAVVVSADREVKVELVPVPRTARSARIPRRTGSPRWRWRRRA